MAGVGLRVGRACVDFFTTRSSGVRGQTLNPCLVYVPGLASHRVGQKSNAFKSLALNQLRFNFATVDLTGHGDASGTLADLTLSKAIADLTNVLQHISGQSERFYLVGASFGAIVAAWTTVEESERLKIAGLVMLSPGLGLKSRLKDGHVLPSDYCGDIVLSPSFVEDLDRYDSQLLAERLTRDKCLEGMVLVMHGERDEVIPCRLVKDWSESVSNCTFWCIPDGNHRLNTHIETLVGRSKDYFERRAEMKMVDS